MQIHEIHEKGFSFKSLFVPITNIKAIYWVATIGVIVYFNSFFNNFVADDFLYIINNPNIHSLNPLDAFGPNSFNVAGQYRAFSALYFSFFYKLFGSITFLYHILQLSLHVSCAFLFYLFLKKYLTEFVSLFLSILFIVHPIQAESAIYIAQTVNPIFSLFGLLALLFLSRKNLSTKYIIISFILLLLSLLTKETGFLFIVLVLLYTILFFPGRLLKLLVASLIIIIFYSYFRFGLGHIGFETRLLTPISDLHLLTRIINIPLIILYYIKALIYPVNLSLGQQWIIASISFSSFYLPLILDLAFFISIGLPGIYILKNKNKLFKIYLFFLIWFALGIILTLQLFPLDKTVSNTWFYFPFMGLLGLLGVTVQSFLPNMQRYKSFYLNIACIILLILSLLTIIRNTNWFDNIALFTHDSLVSDNYEVEEHLGMEYMKDADYKNAIKHYAISVRERPYEYNLLNLGLIYEAIGDKKNAKYYLSKSLQAKDYKLFTPHKHGLNTYLSYASYLILYDNPSDAVYFLKNFALKDYPQSWQLWMYLSLSDYASQNKPEAVDAAKNLYKFNPSETGLSVSSYLLKHDNYSKSDLYNILFMKVSN
jgi:tetratricopeptide (TPR) repeat protein